MPLAQFQHDAPAFLAQDVMLLQQTPQVLHVATQHSRHFVCTVLQQSLPLVRQEHMQSAVSRQHVHMNSPHLVRQLQAHLPTAVHALQMQAPVFLHTSQKHFATFEVHEQRHSPMRLGTSQTITLQTALVQPQITSPIRGPQVSQLSRQPHTTLPVHSTHFSQAPHGLQIILHVRTGQFAIE